MTRVIKNDSSFDYLSDRFGKPLEGVTLTVEANEALRRLQTSFPKGEFAFIARNEQTGAYGLVIEGSEYPYKGTKNSVDDDWYEGRVVNGITLSAGEFPSLPEILKHTAVEADAVNASFPGLEAAIHYGSSTFDGHVTILAFVGEQSQFFSRVTEIGAAMHAAREANMPTVSGARP